MKKKLVIKVFLFCCFILNIQNEVFAKGQFEIIAKTTISHGQNYELTKLQDGRILISEFTQLNSSLDEPIPEEKRLLKRFEIYNPKTKKFEKISQPKIWHYYYTNLLY